MLELTKEKTTIQVDKEVQRRLASLKQRGENYNHVLKRLLSQEANVYVELILVDNELPQTHTVVLQLGEDPRNVYYFNGSEIKPITLTEVQQLLKKPKPNITITHNEAERLIFHFGQVGPISDEDWAVKHRLMKLVEEREKHE